ncbi:alpha/beta hydrolase [Bacillus timonensis]|nr:alpha/beta hydrolase [Bacillus timonensis]
MLEYLLYDKCPNEEYVVLIHGIGGSSRIFYKQLRELKKEYKVIAIHLPGHGKSPDVDHYPDFSPEQTAREILAVLDYLKVKKAHFLGISLGSMAIHTIMQTAPERVHSAVLGGAITRFNHFSKFLVFLGNLIKSFVPFMWIYKIFAYVMMPRNNHKMARQMFIKEAVKMKRSDFLAYFNLVPLAANSYKFVQSRASHVPKLYLSGNEDHLFLDNLRKDIKDDPAAQLVVFQNCGHVCNIDQSDQFNQEMMNFLKKQTKLMKKAQ